MIDRNLVLRSLSIVPALQAALALGILSAPPVFSQAPAAPAPTQPDNLQHPQTSPNLTVDRDPVSSPDAANPTASSGQVQRGKDGAFTLHVDVNEVLLDITVVDEKGHPVVDLKRSDFRIFEDNVPQETSSFTHQDQPVSMGILIDNSGSMLDKRSAVNAAAMQLITESNPKDAAFVVNFNEHAYLDQGLTVDRVALNRGLSHFDSRGTTALYDAVAASADELAHHATERKQLLLIITDGADNASHLTLRDAIRRVQGLGGPVVYTIGLLYDADRNEVQKAHDDLESLSSETGGLAYFPRSIDQVSEIASEVARDVRNQYSLGFRSTKPATFAGYRSIRVEAYSKNHKNLIVRTRRGYYAQPGKQKLTQTAGDPSTNK